MDPRFLLIETSGRSGLAALAAGDQVRALRRLKAERQHARDLAPAVSEMFTQQGWKPRDISAVFVGTGPGSYTGLRVGIVSAKAFGFATGCVLLGVETFRVIAAQAPDTLLHLDVIADAQQNRIYVQSFGRDSPGELMNARSALKILTVDEWLKGLAPEVGVSGPGLRGHRQRFHPDQVIVPEDSWDPQANSLLGLGLARFQAGERDDLGTVEPLYLRPSAAEEKWREGEGASGKPKT
jgi:tRNA threonylcarbamoyladenosine biosynthesis protein TsaB